MKATLEFTLPEESTEFAWASRAGDLAGAITEVDDRLRNWLKHDCGPKDRDDALQSIRDMLADVIGLAMEGV